MNYCFYFRNIYLSNLESDTLMNIDNVLFQHSNQTDDEVQNFKINYK